MRSQHGCRGQFGMVVNGWLNHTRGGRWTEPPIEEALARVKASGFSRVVYYPYGFLADNAESELEGRVALGAGGRPAIEAPRLPERRGGAARGAGASGARRGGIGCPDGPSGGAPARRLRRVALLPRLAARRCRLASGDAIVCDCQSRRGPAMRDRARQRCFSALRAGIGHAGRRTPSGPVAQLAEQQTLNLLVEGSIPSGLTTNYFIITSLQQRAIALPESRQVSVLARVRGSESPRASHREGRGDNAPAS